MQIQVISTSVETKPTTRGSYQQLEVVYKNLTFQGKVESKKLMSFGASVDAFKTLAAPNLQNVVFDVTVVKNDKGYNDWTTATAATAESPANTATPSKASPAPKSNYETPEERAQRQIYIVRQSSLSSAVNVLSVGSKSPPKSTEVIALAKEFEAFVFGTAPVDHGPSGFDDLPDFNADVA